MECINCGKQFQNEVVLGRHIKEEHSKEPCSTLSIIPPTEPQIVVSDTEASEEIGSGNQQVEAGDDASCSGRCSSEDELEAPEKNDANPKKYVCPECQKEFKTEDDMHRHQIMKHTRCYHCGVLFEGRRDNLFRHFRSKHNQCTDCGRQFEERSLLLEHRFIRGKHSMKQKSWWTEKTANRGKHAYPQCGKKFSYNSELQKHSVRHGEEKPFSCHLCECRFKFKNNLSRHMKQKHLE